MIIKSSKIFNNKIFKLSDNLNYETIDTKLEKITIIENFYEDIDLVLSELNKLPITLTYEYLENNITFFDGRKCYMENMKGTEIPYTEHLIKLVSKIIKYPSEFINIQENILINCFRYTDKMKYNLDEYYYSIHRDPINGYYGQKKQVAIVLFLNKHYNDGEGLNFYMPFNLSEKKKDNFVYKKDVEINYFVQAKCNRAVLFDSSLLHGQHTPTHQFKSEMRYTQVIFCPLS